MADHSGNHRFFTRNCLPAPALVLLVPLAITVLLIPAAAHAPSNITIVYNPDMHKLYVTVTHPVDDPATHYLKSVQVKLNGNVISDPPYTSQPGKTSPVYSYDVSANPGDIVWVTATCVKGGSLEAHAEIPRPAAPTLPAQTTASPPGTTSLTAMTAAPPVHPTTYAAAGLLPLAGAAAAVLASRRR